MRTMISVFAWEYLLFTFLANFGVLQIALGSGSIYRRVFGVLVLAFSYFWFFSSRSRNVQSVEGAELFIFFAIGAFSAIAATKILRLALRKP